MISLAAKTLILGGDTRDEEETKEEHDDEKLLQVDDTAVGLTVRVSRFAAYSPWVRCIQINDGTCVLLKTST